MAKGRESDGKRSPRGEARIPATAAAAAEAEGGNPFESAGAFLILMGLAYRLLFSSMTGSFLDNGLSALIIFTGLAAYCLSLVRAHAEPLKVNLASGAFILFFIAYLLAGKSSGYFKAATDPAITVAMLGALFVAASGKLLKRADAAAAAAFLVALTAIIAAVALYQRFYEFPAMKAAIPHMQLPGWVGGTYIDEKSVPDFKTRIDSLEIYSRFFTSNVLAGFMALMLPVTIGLAAAVLRHPSRPRRRFAAAAVCALFAAAEATILVLTKSKGGMAAAGISLSIFAVLLLWRLVPRALFAAGAAAAVAATLVALYGPTPGAKQFYYEARTSLGVRAGYWHATWRMIKDEPLLGVGPGNFADNYVAYKDVGEREVQNPHNAFLLIWAEGGLFTLVFFLAFWVLVFAGPMGREGPSRLPGGYFMAVAILAATAFYILVNPGEILSPPAEGATIPVAVPIVAGALAAAAVAVFFRPLVDGADLSMARAGLAAGVVGFIAASCLDVTFTDAGAAASAIFAAAALSPRGKFAAVKPHGASAFALAGVAALSLVLYAALVFVPRSRVETAMDQSTYRLQLDDLQGAAASAREALAIDPRDPAPLVRLGQIYEIAGRNEEPGAKNHELAEKFYQSAVALNCRSLAAHYGLARVYIAEGPSKYLKALAEYEILLRLYPQSSQFNIGAAGLFEKLGGERAALEHYRRALAIDARVEEHGMQLSPAERDKTAAAIRRLEERVAERGT